MRRSPRSLPVGPAASTPRALSPWACAPTRALTPSCAATCARTRRRTNGQGNGPAVCVVRCWRGPRHGALALRRRIPGGCLAPRPNETPMKLHGLHIPAALRGFAAGAAQVFDITLRGDKVATIEPSAVQAPARGILLSALVEAHAHIDKNYTVQEVGAAQGNLFAAIERMDQHRAGWSAAALRQRRERALHEAWLSGTRALRTHIDWVQPEPPAALALFEALRDEWRGRIELQFVSLTPLDL